MELTRKLFLIFILPATCDDGFFDLYVLMDSSSDVAVSDTREMIDFIQKFSEDFTLGPSNIQMGLWTFGKTVNRNMMMNYFDYVGDFMQDINDNMVFIQG